MNTLLDKALEEIPVHSRVNILSVDLECWEQLVYRRLTGRCPACSLKTVEMTDRLLGLLREKQVKATFFVLGYVAEAFPDLVTRLDTEGHEVATHGYTHTRLEALTPETFREEIRSSVKILSSLTGQPVRGFRAPEFSLGEDTSWALDILADEGLDYDSSIFPIAGKRYGLPEFPRGIVRVNGAGKSIVEVPLSTVSGLSRNWPVAGGGYFRLLPYFLIRRAVKRVNGDGLPFVLYCHPYEFGAERLSFQQPLDATVKQAAFKTRVKDNLFRGHMFRKLSRLLDEFRFAPVKEVLRDALQR